MTQSFTQSLKINQTDAEKRLWSKLRNRQLEGYKFYRQYNIGSYYADFLNRETKLIVEADGGQHGIEIVKDEIRTAFLEKHGYKILRFWNNEILSNTEGVLTVIANELKALTPTLSLKGEGEGGRLCREKALSFQVEGLGEGGCHE